MRRSCGVILILVGLGVAAYALSEPDASSGAGTRSVPMASIPAQLLPPPVSTAVQPLSGHAGKTHGPSPTAAVVRAPVLDAAKQKDAVRSATIPKEGSRTPIGQPHVIVDPPLDRWALTRELQRQLQRLGCYGGTISGTWTPSTQRAMKEFTDRVNATLPTGEPDHILLAMVQNHEDKACGVSCPVGQRLSDNGRCLPGAIVALDAKSRPQAVTERATKLAPPPTGKLHAPFVKPPLITPLGMADADLSTTGRMALAGPRIEADAFLPPASHRAVLPPELRSAVARRSKRLVAKNATTRRRAFGPWFFQEAR